MWLENWSASAPLEIQGLVPGLRLRSDPHSHGLRFLLLNHEKCPVLGPSHLSLTSLVLVADPDPHRTRTVWLQVTFVRNTSCSFSCLIPLFFHTVETFIDTHISVFQTLPTYYYLHLVIIPILFSSLECKLHEGCCPVGFVHHPVLTTGIVLGHIQTTVSADWQVDFVTPSYPYRIP